MKQKLLGSALLVLLSFCPVHAVTYSVTDLGTLGGTTSFAYGINTGGTIVGQADTVSASHAFKYSGGVMTDLGTLGGTTSYASSINSGGTIVGDALTGGGLATPSATRAGS
jgi:probable HAF family extracellular repeat protein